MFEIYSEDGFPAFSYIHCRCILLGLQSAANRVTEVPFALRRFTFVNRPTTALTVVCFGGEGCHP